MVTPQLYSSNTSRVVYTCLIGAYDILRPQPHIPDCDFTCFTDQNITASGWKIIKLPSLNIPNILYAKHPKTQPHLWFDTSITESLWIDANMQLLDSNVFDRLRVIERDNIVLHKHPDRDCIYAEADITLKCCPKYNEYKPNSLEQQSQKYRDLNWPEHAGLFACGFIYRKHHEPNIIKFGELWWEAQINESVQDQISAPYLLHSTTTKPGVIMEDIYNGSFVRISYHV
jgi:hypothetical protein